MASKNITITESAYEQLRALKHDDESFSEVVERLTETADQMEFAGSCPGLGEYVKKARTDLETDIETVDDELSGSLVSAYSGRFHGYRTLRRRL